MKRKIFKAAELILFMIYNRIYALFHRIDKDKVLFLSESHGELDGNLKAVCDGLDGKYEKRIYVKADRRQRGGFSKIDLWNDLTTAGYIMLDDFFGLTSAMRLRKGQELVQLWHGAGAFKKFGFSRINTGDNIRNINKGYRKYTKAVVTSELARPCFAEAFDIPVDRVQAVGSPRTDMFFDEKRIEEARNRVYTAYPHLKGKKIILIAPTYRGRKVEDAYYEFERLRLADISKALGDSYHIITKWHPALYNNIKRGICKLPESLLNAFGDGITDVSGYGDINDILTAADILVTDYSSVIFDYFLLNKPVIYFIYDREDYSSNRGLYFDFKDYIYGDIASDSDELLKAVKAENMHNELRRDFNEKFVKACDGKSTSRVIKWVFEGEYKQ